MSKEEILEKLKKLIKMQEGAIKIGSEGEANNAAAAISRLLIKYNLEMEDIDVTEKQDKVVLDEVMSTYTYKFIGGDWEARLMYVCCKHNFCKQFSYGSSKHKKMIIVGEKENLEIVKWLHRMLSERFVELGKIRYKEYLKSVESEMNRWAGKKDIGLDTYLRRYLMGCCAGLDEKFKTEEAINKKSDQVYNTKLTALVLRNNAAVDTYVANKFGGTHKGKSSKGLPVDSAMRKGLEDGRNASIHKGITESKSSQVNKSNLLG